ncbi:FG-GAP repeat domain-containing protein [Niabella aurantiaca]|uniref:FG-GAP repeat domain-containing protein n=1 Tax=Niabella aurantiaca TaxID=379900 RepID=UPI00146CEC58|nr:VCBS repeat-containing protein [Niabella aurantiaca]
MKPFVCMIVLCLCLPSAAQVVFSKAGYQAGLVGKKVIAADFNGDGKPDLAIANGFWNPAADNGVNVLLNKGNGAFNAAVVYLPGSETNDLAVGDLDNDGHQDIVAVIDTVNAQGAFPGGQLVLLRNNGSGVFAAAAHYPIDNNILAVAAGDFNGDGRADVVVEKDGDIVSVYLNTGNGTLAAPVAVDAGGTRQLAVADLNNDGRPDIAAASGAGNAVSVIFNTGNGTFGSPVRYPVGRYAHYVTIADVDGNGYKDLVVSNRADGSISVLRNDGSGAFGPQAVYRAGQSPSAVAVGDLDGDGNADIAVANVSSSNLSILTGNGNGTFRTGYSAGLMSNLYSVAMADFNGDGKQDLATNSDINAMHLWVWLNAGSYAPNAANILYVNQAVDQMAAGYTGNGSSWENAVPDLADALQWAAAHKSSWTTNAPLKIYVAKGRYLPGYTPEDNHTDPANPADSRDRAFLLVPNVKLYGGFDPEGGITEPWQARIFDAGGSILSGDFNNNDVVSGSGASLIITGNNENAYHVVVASGNAGSAGMDGFTISGGHTNSANPASTIAVNAKNIVRGDGGGMYSGEASPQLTKLIIQSNTAAARGGGIFICDGAQPVFTNSRISGNKAGKGGGIGNQNTGSPVFRNLAISGNSANEGGGVYNANAAPVFANATITGNSAATGGGFNNRVFAAPAVYNSIIWGNQKNGDAAAAGADVENAPNASIVVKNSITQIFNTGNGADNNLTGIDPLFTNAANGQYTLQPGSPAQNSGSNALYTSAGGTISNDRDLADNIRLSGSNIDMGAYESQSVLPVSFGVFTAVIKDGRLLVNWSTETETNNDHFLIQLSADGTNWRTVQTVQSKAADGNSNTSLEYSSSIPLTALGVSAGFLLLGLVVSSRKKKKTLIMAAVLLCALAFSCSKRDIAKTIESGKLFVRIVQVDKDGTQRVSKVIRAVQE